MENSDNESGKRSSDKSEGTQLPDFTPKYASDFRNDIGSVFKIAGEFLEGYEKMFSAGPCVSIFGSSRLKQDSKYYSITRDVARELTTLGFGIITGGGPGLMEAANKGAHESNGRSVGLTIQVPHEDGPNAFVNKAHHIDFKYFFARKVMFVKYAQGFVVFPGGLGTLDELFESLTLIQTGKIERFPIVLMGVDYWEGLIKWMKESMLATGTISETDFDFFLLTDDVKDAVNHIKDFYDFDKLTPNF